MPSPPSLPPTVPSPTQQLHFSFVRTDLKFRVFFAPGDWTGGELDCRTCRVGTEFADEDFGCKPVTSCSPLEVRFREFPS